MLARVITLQFDPVLGRFDDGPLRDFLKDKEVLAIREHFFVRQEVPYLVVLVTYTLQQPEVSPPPLPSHEPSEASWRALLTETDLPLFNTLRDWRSERSKRAGVPPYVICTNRHLAAMVKARPQSLAQLAQVDGFGKAKLEKYGPEMLALLAQSADNHQPAGPAPARETPPDGPAPA